MSTTDGNPGETPRDPVTGEPLPRPEDRPQPAQPSAPPAGWLPPQQGPSEPSDAAEQTYGGWLPPAAGPSQPIGPAPAGPQPAHRRDYASWPSRLGASIVDGLIVFIPIAVLAVIIYFALIDGAFELDSDDEIVYVDGSLNGVDIAVMVIGGLIALVYSLGYAPYWMQRTNGQTIGKQVAGIRVVRTDGRPIGFWFAAMREIALKNMAANLVGYVTFNIAYLLNYLWPLWDKENRAVHDMLVNTRVVKEPPMPAGQVAGPTSG